MKVEPDLRARLASSWAAGAAAAFYAAVTSELCPQIHRALRARFGFDDDQCEDCTGQVLERLVQHDGSGRRRHIVDPVSYVYQSAFNVAIDLIRSEARDREIAAGWSEANGYGSQYAMTPNRPHGDTTEDGAMMDAEDAAGASGDLGPPQIEVPVGWATVVVEESMTETEVDGGWAQEIMRVAIARLPATQRQVIQYLMFEDFDYGSGDVAYRAEQAAAALGMTAGAFRTGKSRAFSRLREEIPKVLAELGIALPPRVAQAITARPPLPSDDDEEAGGSGSPW